MRAVRGRKGLTNPLNRAGDEARRGFSTGRALFEETWAQKEAKHLADK